MVAEERLDGVEALRNPGVDPILAQMIVDPVCPVVHVEPIIGRQAAGPYRPFGLSFLAVRLVLKGRQPAVISAIPANAAPTPACCGREIRSPRITRASSTVTTG
jgi:hypothetical protein